MHAIRLPIPLCPRSVYHKLGGDVPAFTFTQLSSLIRLAHKYQVEDVQTQALDALKTDFTDNFEEWDDVEDYLAVGGGPLRGIEVIYLARLIDAPSMLPLAFYMCLGAGSRVVEGFKREDGTVVHLSSSDLMRFIDGYGAAIRERDLWLHRLCHDPFPSCDTRLSCHASLVTLREEMAEQTDLLDFLHPHDAYFTDVQYPHGYCEQCLDTLKKRDLEERRTLWNELPSMFGLTLEGWGYDATS